MADMVGIMVKVIAERLLENYVARAGDPSDPQPVDRASIPNSPDEIAKGLMKLLGTNLLTVDQIQDVFLKLGSTADVSKIDVLEKAVASFKNLVNGAGNGGFMPVNGILTSDVLSRFLSIPRCNGLLQTTPPTDPVVQPEANDIPLRRIRYFIKGELPKMKDDPSQNAALKVLQEAWIAWVKVAKIDARQTETEANANVLVFRASLDATEGGTLADAHVGPPNGMIFHLRIDTGEDRSWTKKMFRTTMTHEIGHLLGLKHATVNGQLMSPMYDENIDAPTQADVSRLLALGYEAAPPRVPASTPTQGTV